VLSGVSSIVVKDASAIYLANGSSVLFNDLAKSVNSIQANVFYAISISANNSIGLPGQVLASNGNTVYWTNTFDSISANDVTTTLLTVGDAVYNTVITNTGITTKIITVNSISANGFYGNPSDILVSNGSSIYWANAQAEGLIGYSGSIGNTGYAGSQGTAGYAGSQGPQGYAGYVGSQGEPGVPGYPGPAGPAGAYGGDSFEFVYTTNTVSTDPGVGYAAFSNTDLTLANTLYLSEYDWQSTSVNGFIQTIDGSTSTIKGNFKVVDPNNPENFTMFTIIGNHSKGGGYITLPVSYITGANSYSDSFPVILTFTRTGDKGNTGYVGSQGTTGYTGSLGSQGNTGYVGSQGIQGNIGYTGSAGYAGSQGSTGSQGGTGYTGSQGTAGFTGSLGNTGYTGSQGSQGTTGFTGSHGDIGTAGYIGSQGTTGFTGSQGTTGFTGSHGDIGTAGYIGSQGTTGFTGSQGTQGINGYTGSQGTTGFTGSIGSQGGTGYAGSQGGAGGTGYTGSFGSTGFTGSYGNIGYTGSTGYVGSKGDVQPANVVFGDTPPLNPYTGLLWFDSNNAIFNAYYAPANNWIGVNGGGFGPTGFTGSTGAYAAIGYTGSQGVQADLLHVSGNIIPSVSNTYTLGNSTFAWSSLYLGPNSITFTDTLTYNTQVLSVANSVFYITSGTGTNTQFNPLAGFNAGGIVLQNYQIKLANTQQLLYFNTPVGIGNSVADSAQTAFYVSNSGQTTIRNNLQIINPITQTNTAPFTIQSQLGTPQPLSYSGTTFYSINSANLSNRNVYDAYGNGVYVGIAARTSRGTISNPTGLQANDIILRISGNGYRNSGFGTQGSARIDFRSIDSFSDVQNGTQIDFWTTPLGSNVINEVATITATGVTSTSFVAGYGTQNSFINSTSVSTNTTITNYISANGSTGSTGLVLTSGDISSNVSWQLPYIAGTWMPTLIPSTSGTISITTNSATYLKIGPHVTCQFDITVSSMDTSSGNISLGGLPYRSKTASGNVGTVTVAFVTSLSSGKSIPTITGVIGSNSNTSQLWYPAAAGSNFAVSLLPTTEIIATTRFIGTVLYTANT
jgi:hypothetical protein